MNDQATPKPDVEASYQKYSRVILGMLVILVIIMVYHVVYQMPAMAKQNELRLTMRRLWSDHVMYTRLFIIAKLNNLPRLKDTADRLYQNQADIASLIVELKGKKAEVVHPLLVEHIDIASTIVDFLKNDGKRESDEFLVLFGEWQRNARDIAAGLSGLFSLPVEDVTSMMYTHLNLTAEELTAELVGVPSSDMVYDQVYDQAMKMADVLAGF